MFAAVFAGQCAPMWPNVVGENPVTEHKTRGPHRTPRLFSPQLDLETCAALVGSRNRFDEAGLVPGGQPGDSPKRILTLLGVSPDWRIRNPHGGRSIRPLATTTQRARRRAFVRPVVINTALSLHQAGSHRSPP